MNVSLIDIFKLFFMIGCQLIGGGYVIIPLLKKAVVENKKWLTTEELVKYISLSKCLPGLIAINVSLFIGHKLKGLSGAIVATIAVILSPIAAILLIIKLFGVIIDNPMVQDSFWGIRAGILVLIFLAVQELYKNTHKDKKFYWTYFTILTLVLFSKFSPVFVIIGSCGYAIISVLVKKRHET